METFSELWNNEVKQLAMACVTAPNLLCTLDQNDNCQSNQDEKEETNNTIEQCKDVYGMYCIANMILTVEKALAEDKKAIAILAIVQIYELLNKPHYFQNLFNSDENDEEWQNRAALRDGLYKLLQI